MRTFMNQAAFLIGLIEAAQKYESMPVHEKHTHSAARIAVEVGLADELGSSDDLALAIEFFARGPYHDLHWGTAVLMARRHEELAWMSYLKHSSKKVV